MPKKYWYLSFISGVMLSLPWYDVFPGFILFIAFVPLLLAEQYLFEFKKHFSSQLLFLLAFITFFTWNLLSLWWIVKISVVALILIVVFNTVLYSFIFWLFHVIKRLNGIIIGYFAFIVFWISFEFYSLHSELSFSWLVLGNGMANHIPFIQWYEYTGVLGGSLWILLINSLVVEIFRFYRNGAFYRIKWLMFSLFTVLIIPLITSLLIYNWYTENGEVCNVTIIQPNIDPFIEKFSSLTPEEQIDRMLNLADSAENGQTDYYIMPETALDKDIWEDNLINNYSLFLVRNFISQHPNSSLFTGAITYLDYPEISLKTSTARFDTVGMRYYDVFNTAIQIDTSSKVQIYHKSKLVLGAEKVLFPSVFRFFDTYLINLGGITGSLGEGKEQVVFNHLSKPFFVAPVICYESVFGEYVARYCTKGANILFVITNDGWWGGTMGYKQHLRYSQLRAIETRRSIARSANTGISAFINQRGEITRYAGWWQQTVISDSIKTNKKITFYSRFGDFIGRFGLLLSIVLLLFGAYRLMAKKHRFKH